MQQADNLFLNGIELHVYGFGNQYAVKSVGGMFKKRCQNMLVQPEGLPHQSFDPVAPGGLAESFTDNKAYLATAVRTGQETEPQVNRCASKGYSILLKQALKFFTSP
ncbi:MAG: hypothetical protein R3281_17490, partial [Balneolaceae bacterium]|nr:hypothetical protein [Balneolaceae bacterium]